MISDRPGFWRGFRFGAAFGLIVGLMTMCGTARADSPQSSPHSDGAAFAVATSGDGSTITLHSGQGICRGEARAAIWRPAPGSDAAPIPGCWIITGAFVLVSFLDGERGDIPVARLVKTRSL